MRIDRLYDRLSPSCSTVNELNQLHIRLENRMTPVEATALASHIHDAHTSPTGTHLVDALRDLGSKAGARIHGRRGARALSPRARRVRSLEWADKTCRQLRLASTPDPSPFVRRWLRGGAALFQAGTTPSSALVIGFTGNARRLMMPAPVFLQHLAPFAADLLLLDVPRGSIYIDGVQGFSTDFPNTVDWLAEFIHAHGATRTLLVGTSGGALPAVLAGFALPAHAVLAVGPFIGLAPSYSRVGGTPTLGEVVAQYVTPGTSTRVSLLFGADSALDRTAASSLAEEIPQARLVPVVGAGHNCLYPLAERGELEGALASALFQEQPVPDQVSW